MYKEKLASALGECERQLIIIEQMGEFLAQKGAQKDGGMEVLHAARDSRGTRGPLAQGSQWHAHLSDQLVARAVTPRDMVRHRPGAINPWPRTELH